MGNLHIRHLILISACLCIMLAGIVMPYPAKAAGTTVKVALASPMSPMTVLAEYGPLQNGAAFGLNMGKDDFTTFTSDTLSTSAVLSGDADVEMGVFTALLLLRQSGQDFKAFCPLNGQIDHVLVGRNGIKTLAQVVEPNTRVAISAPNGGATTELNALLYTQNMGLTVKDLKNTKLIDNINTRQTAWAANEVDATMIRLSQFRQSQKDVPDGVIILKTYEVLPVFIFNAYVASSAWLEKNRDTAAALCASVMKGGIEMTAAYDAYHSAVHEVMDKPPSDDELKESYGLITQYGFWSPAKSMNTDAVNYMSKISIASGILKQAPDPNDVLDMKTYNLALSLLSDDDRKALVQMAVSATPQATLSATLNTVATQNP